MSCDCGVHSRAAILTWISLFAADLPSDLLFQLRLFPGYEKWTYPLYPVMFIAECGLALWLLIRGVKDIPEEKSAGGKRPA
jgi:hypothetical protein